MNRNCNGPLVLFFVALLTSALFGGGPEPRIPVESADIADDSVTNAKLAEPVSVANGGTGKTTAAEALAALGGASLNGSSTVAFNASTINGVAPLTAAEKTQALALENKVPIVLEYAASNTEWISGGYGGGISAGIVTVSPLVNDAYASATRLTGVTGGAITYESTKFAHRSAGTLTYYVRVLSGDYFYSTSYINYYDANGLFIRSLPIHTDRGEGSIAEGYNADTSGPTDWSLHTVSIPFYPDAPYITLVIAQELSSTVERTGFVLK